MTDYTEADAAAEYVRSSGQKPMGMFFPSVDECDTLLAHAYKIAPAYQQLRTENARLAADLAAARTERDALAKALRGLLDDTQHKNHDCGPGWCPVAYAKAVLAAPHLNPTAEGGAK